MGVVIHGYGALFDVGMEVVRGMHASQNGGGELVGCMSDDAGELPKCEVMQ